MPCKAMMKFTTRYGCRFSCGWDPPVFETIDRFNAVLDVRAMVDPLELASTFLASALTSQARSRRDDMDVGGHFADVTVWNSWPPDFPLSETAPEVHRRTATQIRQREGRLPVAPIRGAEHREQRLVLVDGQQLPVAERPPLGGKFQLMILISAKKGCDILLSPSRLLNPSE